MERHQRAVVKNFSHLGQVWVYASHKPELLTTGMMVSDRTPICKVRAGFVNLLNTNGSFGWPVWTTYKQFGVICICHIGYVAICQTRKIDICWCSNIAICQPCNTTICQNGKIDISWSSNIAICQPCNTTIYQNMQLKITSSVYFLQLKFSN